MGRKPPKEQKPPTDRVRAADLVSEVADLMSLAAWYRCWAEITGSEQDKKSRLEMAVALEVKARTLMK
jgi:hypothetical protein